MLAAICVVVLVGVVMLAVGTSTVQSTAAPAHSSPAVESPFLPSVTAVGAAVEAPWARPDDPTARAAAAGLRMLDTEGTVEHIHAHLTISIDGQQQSVPGEIGIDNPSNTVSPLHTHDTSGIIHVESPVEAQFTLGQFFTEWNVALDARSIGSYASSDTETFTVFVDQKPFVGDPASIVFTNRMEIDIVVAPTGTAAVPSPPFDWPPQY